MRRRAFLTVWLYGDCCFWTMGLGSHLEQLVRWYPAAHRLELFECGFVQCVQQQNTVVRWKRCNCPTNRIF